MLKCLVRWVNVEIRLDSGEIWRVLDRLLGPQNKTLNETNPSINAKLPATQYNLGGGRTKSLHPIVTPPGRNPSINIRQYKQKPVKPVWLLERCVMTTEMMETLRSAVEESYRIMIVGGTRTGKTTLLSAVCNFLPAGLRIVKIEDPGEIWIDRPTVKNMQLDEAFVRAKRRANVQNGSQNMWLWIARGVKTNLIPAMQVGGRGQEMAFWWCMNYKEAWQQAVCWSSARIDLGTSSTRSQCILAVVMWRTERNRSGYY